MTEWQQRKEKLEKLAECAPPVYKRAISESIQLMEDMRSTLIEVDNYNIAMQKKTTFALKDML